MIDNPIGIDYPIQIVQKSFIDELWLDVDDSKKQFNARVFRNYDKDGNIYPEIYLDNGDYKKVRFNDNLDVLSWFDVPDTPTSFDSGYETSIVGIFFAVNIEKLYPGLSHRAVEEVHRDVLNVLDITNVQDGIIKGGPAFGDFNTNLDSLKGFNVQPWHVFRINYLMSYTTNC